MQAASSHHQLVASDWHQDLFEKLPTVAARYPASSALLVLAPLEEPKNKKGENRNEGIPGIKEHKWIIEFTSTTGVQIHGYLSDKVCLLLSKEILKTDDHTESASQFSWTIGMALEQCVNLALDIFSTSSGVSV